MSEQYENPLDIVLPEEQMAMDIFKKYKTRRTNKNHRIKLLAMVDKCNNMNFLFKVALMLKDGTHGAKKNIIRACSILSKICGFAVIGLEERGKLLEPLHKLNIHMNYELSGDEMQESPKLEGFLSFAEDNLKNTFDPNDPIAEQIFNELCCGKLDRAALDLIDELTYPELICQIAMSYRDGKNGFEQDLEKSEYYMNMAAGYLHTKAIWKLKSKGIHDTLGLLAMSIDRERCKRDPLFKVKRDAEFKEDLNAVFDGLADFAKNDEGFKEFMAKERKNKLEAQGDLV